MGDSVGTPHPAAGAVLAGRYRLTEPAGSGAMAQVWSATDTILNRRVAVKVLHPHLRSDDTFRERFRQEARSAARLHHHAVVAVFDTVSGPEAEAIVMEYVEGETLRTVLDRQGPLPPAVVARIATEVAGALDTAHQTGLTHRDVKPANILLTGDPTRGGVVKVADFGIAKADADADLTQDGTLVGTAAYLAPEQVEGLDADGRADQFALGVVLYEALTGRLPFTGDTDAARAVARLHQTPVRPDHLVPDVSPAMADAIMTALARRPEDRFATAGEMAAAVEAGRHRMPATDTVPVPTVTAATPVAPPGRPRSSTRRPNRRWIGATLLVLVVGAALLLVAALVGSPPELAERTSPADGVPNESALIPIRTVTPFDPEGSGTPGENDDQAARTIDGNSETAWRSETYQRADFFIKSGVGLEIRLDRATTLDRLDLDTLTPGWSAEVHLPDGPPEAAPTGEPVAGISDAPEQVSFDLGGQPGDRVLVWFTELGPVDRGYRVEVAEIRVAGRI